MTKNILLCTLGASWAVIPEAYAFLAPEKLPLYQNHPQKDHLEALKNSCQLQAPDEIWVCTTQGQQTQQSLDLLQQWQQALNAPPILRIWQAAHTDQLASQAECEHIRELIVRAGLKAHAHANGGQVVLSLAGGRKTMSADLQWAGSLLGCQALLHVISDDSRLINSDLFKPQPQLLAQQLRAELAQLITPLIAGHTLRSDLLDITVDHTGPIETDLYPLLLPEDNQALQFTGENQLTTELSKREKASSRLFGNYLQDISRDERHENWRSLYRLPPRQINKLRTTQLGEQHRDWLIKLPKADLHRHLGGCLNLPAQRQVAQAIWQAMTGAEQNDALEQCKPLLESPKWPMEWPDTIKKRDKRSHFSAALLTHAKTDQLEYNLWEATGPRLALKNSAYGFAAYERPGELSGSALLSHPAAIKPYAEAIVQQAVAEGLAYVELRGSPQKYGDGLRFLTDFYQALKSALASLTTQRQPIFRFIIIADRRDPPEKLKTTIAMAVQAKYVLPDFIAGIDLAGDEKQASPEQLAPLFTDAFKECLPITIHAGEGESAESIWQAAYHLHADRIGHGLTLNDNDKLAQRFRDRNICLELCPTSNREVVGYRDPHYPQSQSYPTYPLIELWQKGLPLTLCTDNPGISRTTLADEYLAAARMTDPALSQWDVLAIIKQGFVHSFMPGREKETLLKTIDAQLYQFISETQ
ncbi:CRISPR-associated ring nuclease [Methylicorpusculum oleiharenae]|uniref:CRISPR-associated ring nuclease n=1 Tax=Methylicorpusculum oleiharenae TaxID=1338687 RepID=UPI001E51E39A|nr:CRISPR-associated ring nuclease [Methylicorpusculum oleiharenae]MCD2452426.1 CRISPR-associated ring nuclease [Methylicorpusculum oleiharenae]